MSKQSCNEAALDLTCLMNDLLRKPSRFPADDRRKIRRRYVRGLAALNGHELPAGDTIDKDTAREAFEALCKALTLNGIDNAEIVAWFNDSTWQRQQQDAR
jgi:hypothetical protein